MKTNLRGINASKTWASTSYSTATAAPKKSTLDRFANNVLSQSGNLFVFDAYEPEFTLKALLFSIEHHPELSIGTGSTPESISAYFPSATSEQVYLIINS